MERESLADDVWDKLYQAIKWFTVEGKPMLDTSKFLKVVECARSDVETAFSMYWTESEMVHVPPTGYRGKKTWDWTNLKRVVQFDFSFGMESEVNMELTLELDDERFIYAQADCDTTGWNCQSGGRMYMASNIQDINTYAKSYK